MRLSNYFTLEEMTFSQTATRRGLPNEPGEAERYALRLLCLHVLDPLRMLLSRPVFVTSGYRSPTVNRRIGGARTSQHTRGEAADIRVDGISIDELVRGIVKSGIEFDQVIHEGTWVHVSYSRRRNRRQVLRAIFDPVSGTRYEVLKV